MIMLSRQCFGIFDNAAMLQQKIVISIRRVALQELDDLKKSESFNKNYD